MYKDIFTDLVRNDKPERLIRSAGFYSAGRSTGRCPLWLGFLGGGGLGAWFLCLLWSDRWFRRAWCRCRSCLWLGGSKRWHLNCDHHPPKLGGYLASLVYADLMAFCRCPDVTISKQPADFALGAVPCTRVVWIIIDE